MKGFLGIFLLSLTFFAIGQELDLSGDLTGRKARWTLHGYEGFQPSARVKTVKEGSSGKDFLQIRSVRGELGTLLFHQRSFPAVNGDSVQVTLRLRGKGVGAVCLHLFTKDGKWNGPSRTGNFKLTAQWESVAVTLPVNDGFAGKTHSFRICIGSGPGAEMDAADIKAFFHAGKK